MPLPGAKLQPPPVSPGVLHTNDMSSTTNSGGPGAITPTRKDQRQGMDSKRRQTLLSLLDALTELQRDEDSTLAGSVYSKKLEKELEEPVEDADERLQKAGYDVFMKFQKRITSLDRELRSFANNTRQLGSSVRILSSAFHLRERLALVLCLFRENAADLFPRKVQREGPETFFLDANRRQHEKSSMKRNQRQRRSTLQHIARPVIAEKPDPEYFPQRLEELAHDVMTFLESLNEFPEFTDEAVDHAIIAFEADLKYWASCLKTYEGQFKYPAVQRYLHDLSAEMGNHLDTITTALSMFLEVGIPMIRFSQQHAASNLQNLTTVATFFSAVTATTLQFSFNQTRSHLTDAVNSFWFCSLVFSIASAVNSLLGLTWKQAMYRSPGHRVPWWVLIWIKRSPLIFLVVAVAAFSVGLCVFTYSTGQSAVTSALTTIFTAFSSFGLTAVSAWFVFERWAFNRHRGKKWLMDVLFEMKAEMDNSPIMLWFSKVPSRHAQRVADWSGKNARRVSTTISRVGTQISITRFHREGTRDGEGGPEGLHQSANHSEEPLPLSRITPMLSPSTEIVSSPVTSTGPLPPSISSASLCSSPTDDSHGGDSPTSPLAGKRRFANIVRNVIRMNGAASQGMAFTTISPRRQQTGSSIGFASGVDGRDGDTVSTSLRVGRIATLIPALKSLKPTQLLQPHTALVRHLQFSPNGDFLATCSWDRTCMIFRVTDFSSPHRVLAHAQGFVGQVAWSPKGDLLLTKMIRGMKIWTADSGVLRKTIDRQRSVQSVAWFPQGEAFLSVEENEVTKLDLNGKVMDTFRFNRMVLHDVAITTDQARMLCVATLTASPDGLKPSMSREEKQIIVFNLDKKEIENQVPVLHDVRDITLAKNGSLALVSYENKAPPQLWKLEYVRDRNTEASVTARLSLINTYMPKAPVDFAGPSYFGGKDDGLVLCAGKSGDIHIWDRATGYLLHNFQADDLDGDLTCIAWNHAASPFMFATGSHDGTVRIWTSPSGYSSSGLNTPRTNTPPPFTLEVTSRSDSPVNDLDIRQSRSRSNSRDERPVSPDQRKVVFTPSIS